MTSMKKYFEAPMNESRFMSNGKVDKGQPIGAPWMDDALLDAANMYREKVEAGLSEHHAYFETAEEYPRIDYRAASFVNNQDFEWFWLNVEREGLQVPDLPIKGRPSRWTIKRWLDEFKKNLRAIV
jgi:hypothetical protein